MTNSHPTELLPWHKDIYENLCRLNSRQTLAHAYLLEGQKGLGKLTLAKHFGHYMLCDSPRDMQPCGECGACHLLAANTHPGLKLIEPEEKSRNIKIDQVRALLEYMATTSLRGERKVIIISPAEGLNTNAANALLKGLEEPAAGTLLLLVSHQPAQLMATIKSRCQRLSFMRPETEQAKAWLESKNVRTPAQTLLNLANGAPLRALHLADEDALHERGVLHKVLEQLLSGKLHVVEAAVECAKFSISDNIEGMMLCIADVLEFNQAGQQGQLRDPELAGLANSLTGKDTIKALHHCYQDLQKVREALNSTANPAPQLILESIFYTWSRLKGAEGIERTEGTRI